MGFPKGASIPFGCERGLNPLARIKNAAASNGVSKQTRAEGIVGWVEAQSADTHRAGTMGIAELVLSFAEGLHPSYAGLLTQQAAGN